MGRNCKEVQGLLKPHDQLSLKRYNFLNENNVNRTILNNAEYLKHRNKIRTIISNKEDKLSNSDKGLEISLIFMKSTRPVQFFTGDISKAVILSTTAWEGWSYGKVPRGTEDVDLYEYDLLHEISHAVRSFRAGDSADFGHSLEFQDIFREFCPEKKLQWFENSYSVGDPIYNGKPFIII